MDMGDDVFFGNDPFGTQSITPGLGTLHTKGTEKLLVVIFVIDCSKTMSGDRIGAVNAAMQELKYKLTEIKKDNNLDLKIAIMSFASSAKWELELTPIEEVSLDTIHTRPGLTEYGAAFHELNKVLRREAYMKHTGKTAPPAIMFLTDGEPEDDYQADLEELLKNGWFANASRSAVLLGDAINNISAKNAVCQFVNNADADIVTAEDSTVIIQKIRIATMHTVAGEPMQDDKETIYVNDANKTSNISGTVGNNQPDPHCDDDTLLNDDPFGSAASSDKGSVQKDDNPFGKGAVSNDDPFGGSQNRGDDPFGNPISLAGDSTQKDDDPRVDAIEPNNNPLGNSLSTGANPLGNATVDIDNPFGNSTTGNDRFGGEDNLVDGLI